MSAASRRIKVRLAILEERSKGERRVRKAQALEYERRLTDLNHAHAKQVEDQRTYISEDKFTGHISEFTQFRTLTDAVLAELKGRTDGMGRSRANMYQVLPIIISCLALVFVAWQAYKGL